MDDPLGNAEEFKEDPLREFMNPDRIEKAPVHFTEEVITKIRIGSAKEPTGEKVHKRNPVPLISLIVIVILITISFIIPAEGEDFLSTPLPEFLKNIDLSLPETGLSVFLKDKVPGLSVIYLLASLFVFSLFDNFLHRLFYSDSKK